MLETIRVYITTFNILLFAAMYNDYADEDILDADPEPNPEPSVPPSPSPVPPLDPPAVSPSPCQGPSPARVHVVLSFCVYTSQKKR